MVPWCRSRIPGSRPRVRQHRGEQVHADQAADLTERAAGERPVPAGAGVVDQHVDPPVAGQGALDERQHGGLGEIGGGARASPPASLIARAWASSSGARRAARITDAPRGQLPGGDRANPGTGPGHDRHLTSQPGGPRQRAEGAGLAYRSIPNHPFPAGWLAGVRDRRGGVPPVPHGGQLDLRARLHHRPEAQLAPGLPDRLPVVVPKNATPSRVIGGRCAVGSAPPAARPGNRPRSGR